MWAKLLDTPPLLTRGQCPISTMDIHRVPLGFLALNWPATTRRSEAAAQCHTISIKLTLTQISKAAISHKYSPVIGVSYFSLNIFVGSSSRLIQDHSTVQFLQSLLFVSLGEAVDNGSNDGEHELGRSSNCESRVDIVHFSCDAFEVCPSKFGIFCS